MQGVIKKNYIRLFLFFCFTFLPLVIVYFNIPKLNFTKEISRFDRLILQAGYTSSVVEDISGTFDVQSIDFVGEGEAGRAYIYLKQGQREKVDEILTKYEDVNVIWQDFSPQFRFPFESMALYIFSVYFVLVAATLFFSKKMSIFKNKLIYSLINLFLLTCVLVIVINLAFILSILGWQISLFTFGTIEAIAIILMFVFIYLFKTLVENTGDDLSINSLKASLSKFTKTNLINIVKALLIMTSFSIPFMFVYDMTVEIGLVIISAWIGTLVYLLGLETILGLMETSKPKAGKRKA
jgi:hypothetical protein